MFKSQSPVRTFLLTALVCGCLMSWQTTNAQENQVQKPVPLADGQIQFNFINFMEWEPLIELYAKAAGLALQKIDPPPAGTFNYRSERVMSMTEALDLINQNLIMRNRVLIRSRDQLLLFDLEEGIPDDIIETVTPEELDARGKYEILKCSFSLEGLDATQIRSQIEPLVSQKHRRNLTVIPAANLIKVEETVMNLREIRAVLEIARNAFGPNNWKIVSVVLKHVSPDEILAHANLVGINRDTLSSEDGNLRLSIDPFSAKLYITGTPQKVSQFLRLVDEIDVAPEDIGESTVEAPYFDRYAVRGDAVLIHEVLQTLLSNRPDIKLDVDEKTGQIFLLGRQDDHKLVQDTINRVEGSSDELAVIDLHDYDPDDMIDKLQTLFRQMDDETSATGPVFTADSLNHRLIVRGTPQEVAMAQKIVSQLDIPFSSPSEGMERRFIPLNTSELNNTLGFFEEMWPTLGRTNEINVELPGARKLFFDYEQKRLFDVYGLDNQTKPDESDDAQDATLPDEDRGEQEKSDGRQSHTMPRLNSQFGQLLSPVSLFTASTGIWHPQDQQDKDQQDNGSGLASGETARPQQDEKPKSVPGSPIDIRVNNFGLMLDSKDLDALDEIEQMIMEHLNQSAATGTLALFLLKHRDANEARELLEMYLGLSSGGGGGGGGIGSLIGGAMSNAMGPAGEMIGGLLGGGGGLGAGGGIYEPEGPVSIVSDVKNYSIMVRASAVDMDMIKQLVDLIDQPELGQRPQPLGTTYTIAIRYRDAFEIEAIVRQNLSLILRSSEQGGANAQNQANQQAQMQQQFMRALLGNRGRGGGGGSAAADIEPPKASMSVDEKNQTLVVTGPQFIYDQIFDMVRVLDVPNTRPAPFLHMMPINGAINAQDLENSLRAAFGDMLEFVESSESMQTGQGATGNTNRPASSPTTPRTITPGAIDPQQLQRIQSFMRGQGRGQGGTRGTRGGDRGGGDRGGGDRGGPGGTTRGNRGG